MIRVVLPAQLRTLANVGGEVVLQVESPATIATVLDALETQYPTLRGTIRDQLTWQRRPFIRFFVGREDLSQDAQTTLLPVEVASGTLPFRVVGAMAGG